MSLFLFLVLYLKITAKNGLPANLQLLAVENNDLISASPYHNKCTLSAYQ